MTTIKTELVMFKTAKQALDFIYRNSEMVIEVNRKIYSHPDGGFVVQLQQIQINLYNEGCYSILMADMREARKLRDKLAVNIFNTRHAPIFDRQWMFDGYNDRNEAELPIVSPGIGF